jgi:IPT/TIG domain-containing protein
VHFFSLIEGNPVPVLIWSRSHAAAFRWPALLLLALAPAAARAGGPKYVAGPAYFNPSVVGQPLRWSAGQLRYFVDQGPLNGSISNAQATAMVDAAAALWSAVPTAGATVTDMGQLNEDVNGANVQVNAAGEFTAPADVTPASTNYPLAVIYDADGSVIDALYGADASQPESCQNNGVLVWIDNFQPDATLAHAVIVLNGLCATDANLVEMMSFALERAFGRVLGLDFSQVNPGALTGNEPDGTQGWPVMQPVSGLCGPAGGACIPNPGQLRYDDIAALNRLYPITAANLAAFPGKQITAANTVSIRGTLSFRTGYGMQGVNVVARPLDVNGNPLYQYTVAFVSGAYFGGNHGSPVTGFTDAYGNPLSMWGSNDPTLQGYFDLSGIPLPPGVSSADYQVTFEPVDPLYILENSVGPYASGQVAPSGTLAPVTLARLSAGSAQTLSLTAPDSAVGGYEDSIGAAAQPRPMPATGLWCGRLSQVGQTDWIAFPARGNRIFTVVTQAIDESGAPSNAKAMPSIGVWNGFDPVSAPDAGFAPGFNGYAAGETWLRVATSGADIVRLGIADLRGDGRPDYAYNGWLLYADTVSPTHLPASGGPIVIQGTGFHPSDTVLVGGRPALVVSITPNEIDAIAPQAAAGVTGSVDVEVDDLPTYYAAAVIPGGLSYDSGTGDGLTLVSAPSGTVPIGVPVPFTVTALAPDLSPASGVTVTFTVTSGSATLACGQPVCSMTATGDGRATMNVTATGPALSVITASLTNGSSLEAQFTGGTPPTLAAVTPQLSLAAGAVFTWTVQALALLNGAPAPGQSIAWQSATGINTPSAPVITGANGVAAQTLTVGPLTEGQTATINACLNGTNQCVAFTAFGARPEYAVLRPVSGASQSIPLSATPSQVVLRLLDMNSNPMAGGTVTLYQSLYAWTPPCAPHAVCAQGALLATQTATATSAVDGSVVFTPASLPAMSTSLAGLAASGNTSTASIAIEQH